MSVQNVRKLLKNSGDKLMPTFEERYKQCKIENDRITKANCLFELLRDVSEFQDNINLSIPIINQNVRAIRNILDNANSLFLDGSKYKGNPKPLLHYGYFNEKIESLIRNYNVFIHDYNLTIENKNELQKKLKCQWFDDREGEIAPKDVIEYYKKELFTDQDKLKYYKGRE